jgi:hypothetical protein
MLKKSEIKIRTFSGNEGQIMKDCNIEGWQMTRCDSMSLISDGFKEELWPIKYTRSKDKSS